QVVRDEIRPAIAIEVGDFKIAPLEISLGWDLKSHGWLRLEPAPVHCAEKNLPLGGGSLDHQVGAAIAIKITVDEKRPLPRSVPRQEDGQRDGDLRIM